MADDSLEARIQQCVQSPKRAKNDSGEVEQQPLTDLIVVDRYLNSKKAARAKGLGIRITKIVPPGTE